VPRRNVQLNSLKKPAQQEIEQPAGPILLRAAWLQEDGGQGRTERERVECRDHRRDGDGQGELPKKLAGDAADERAGHEHRRQHQGHGDDGSGNLFHGLVGGAARRQAVFDVVLDRFDDDDGVVDHDADGQHQAEQRQIIQTEANGGHGSEGGR